MKSEIQTDVASIDDDIDLVDYKFLEQCMAGAGQPPASSYGMGANSDFDNDGDCDLADYALFTMVFSNRE